MMNHDLAAPASPTGSLTGEVGAAIAELGDRINTLEQRIDPVLGNASPAPDQAPDHYTSAYASQLRSLRDLIVHVDQIIARVEL
jgi:hypothetical protein